MLAYLDAEGNLRVRHEDGAERTLTSPWMMADPKVPDGRSVWRWPTWRPDGSAVALVGLLVEDRRVLSEIVWLLPTVGSVGDGLADLPESSLVYLEWSPEGEQLALLLQDEAGVFLELVRDVGVPREREPLSRGGPLFLAQGRGEIITHVRAETGEGRLWIKSRGESWEHPGWFRTPWLREDGTVVCTRRESDESHVLGVLGGGKFDAIGPLAGRVAMVPLSASVALVAEAASLESPGYVTIWFLDMDTGRLERVLDAETLAIFPAGPRSAVRVSGTPKTGLVWSLIDLDGDLDRPLGGFSLSAADLLRIGFFDQYSASHPVVSADGTTLVVSGFPIGETQEQSGIYLVATDGKSAPRRIGDGSFATFAPAPGLVTPRLAS